MAQEIERKYLVDRKKWQALTKPAGQLYRQGYLLTDPQKTIRVRLTEASGFLTIKGATKGATRPEYEYEIPVKDAKELLDNFSDAELTKTRYKVTYKNKLWEVDEFLDDNEGLIVAEIELKSEGELFDVPDWIGKEVTGEEKYYNANLVLNPYQNWEPESPKIYHSKVPWEILNDIADSMEAGLKCFLHKTTYEVITIPNEDRFPGIDWEAGDWEEATDKVFGNPEYIEIEKMDSSESFSVMEDFVISLPNNATKTRLLTALEGHKPFGNFNHQIHNAGKEREQWFKFRRERGIEWVRKQVEMRLQNK